MKIFFQLENFSFSLISQTSLRALSLFFLSLEVKGKKPLKTLISPDFLLRHRRRRDSSLWFGRTTADPIWPRVFVFCAEGGGRGRGGFVVLVLSELGKEERRVRPNRSRRNVQEPASRAGAEELLQSSLLYLH